MSFAFPLALGIGAVALAVVTALHVLSWRVPEPRVLPTARFLPGGSPHARWRRVAPSDAGVWALRMLALAALSVAAAGPVVSTPSSGVARVIVADLSRAVSDVAELRDSVRVAQQGAAETRLVGFDSTARLISADGVRLAPVRGELTAGLVLAVRHARALAERRGEVEIIVVTPAVRESQSVALGAIAGAWPGSISWRRVAAATPTSASLGPDTVLPSTDDVVGAAMRAAGAASTAGVRVTRNTLTAADTAFARSGGVVVEWLAIAEDTTLGALSGGGRAMVGRLGRASVPAGTPLLQWSDGEVAATQTSLGAGCVRRVGVGLPSRGDFVLRPGVSAVLRALLVPCHAADLTPTEQVSWTHGVTGKLPAAAQPNVWITRALILLALVALVAEMMVRRRRRTVAVPMRASQLEKAA